MVFYCWEGVRSMRYELRRYRYEISFDILLLGGSKINFLLLGRSEECEIWIKKYRYKNFFWYFITRRV